jgi:hypothetical protein
MGLKGMVVSIVAFVAGAQGASSSVHEEVH